MQHFQWDGPNTAQYRCLLTTLVLTFYMYHEQLVAGTSHHSLFSVGHVTWLINKGFLWD